MSSIPTSIIGILSQILPDHYTHNEIDSLFLYAGAPDSIPEGSKPNKVKQWLRTINVQSDQPLRVLGTILEDFLEKESPGNSYWHGTTSEIEDQFKKAQAKVREVLGREGLTFHKGGQISTATSSSTLSLEQRVRRDGLATIDVEIQRALSQVGSDPQSASQYAGNVLEATLKVYLDRKLVSYSETAGLSDLWKATSNHIGLRPAEWDSKDLKKIASGLNNIVDGISHLRNKKSSAHGQSEAQAKSFAVRPRHARLAIHSAHSVAAYILELLE